MKQKEEERKGLDGVELDKIQVQIDEVSASTFSFI
jgi:hypothetical protein